MSAIRLLPPAATKALLAIDGPAAATFNTIIEAQNAYEGGAGNAITLELAAGGLWVPNVGTLTLVANPGDTETCTLGDNVYTFQTVLTNVAGNVLIGASASATLDNLIAAINLGSGAGTTYAAATAIHPTCRAFAGAGDTMVVHTKSDTILTAVGTLIATTDGMANAGNVWGATTLADGTNGTNVAFSVTGTAISVVFSSGYTTVSDFETALAAHAATSALVRVKTAGTTPLYQLVITDDDFSATNLTGGGSVTVAAPTLTSNTAAGWKKVPKTCDQAIFTVRNVDNVASIVKTASPVIWGWIEDLQYAYRIGPLNGGTAIGECSADKISYAEHLVGLRGFSHFYVELATSGTGTEVEVHAKCIPAEPVSK